MTTSGNRAFVNQVVIGTLVAIGVSGSVGIGAVRMRHQISVTAEANKAIENRLAEVGRLTQQTSTWIAEEQDVTALVKRNSELRLGLMPPQDGQVQRITEDPVALFTAKRDRGLFQDRGLLQSEVELAKTFSAAAGEVSSAIVGTQSSPGKIGIGIGSASMFPSFLQGVVQPKDSVRSISFRVAVRR
jgi:hypothetical protein